MSRLKDIAIFVALAALGSVLVLLPSHSAAADIRPAEVIPAQEKAAAEQAPTAPQAGVAGKLIVTVGMSITIDSPLNIQRVYIANGELAEAVAINPKEVLITGRGAGVTTLMVWQQGGTRLTYDLTVRPSLVKLDALRMQVARDYPDEDINITQEGESIFVRGTVTDVTAANRVIQMATTLGKPVNLLRVKVPEPEAEILLKVRFADVDRSAASDLGANIVSTAFNQSTGISTGQYGNTGFDSAGSTINLSSALNVLLFRKDLNLGVTIKALESKNLLETLSEPNVLAINGKEASFLSGGQFPVPMVQGSQQLGTVTIMFKEYGIRLTFTPNITPRGTIRLKVSPEVSSLDLANSVQISGFTIPALTTRKVDTEVELEDGQSFVIAGLLDNQATENFSKIPGLSAIPVLGKLFQSRSTSKKNTELLVIVTPELVRPIGVSQKLTDLKMPMPFMPKNTDAAMHTPEMDKTGPMPVHPPRETMPIEELVQDRQKGEAAPDAQNNQNQAVPPLPSMNGTQGRTGVK